MKKILVAYHIPYEGLENLSDNYEIIYPGKTFFSKEEMIQRVVDCDAVLSIFSMPIDKDIIDAGKKLKIISNYGVGYNNIDISAANKKGIAVTNTPKAVCIPTAELCLGLILSLSRRISECNHRLRVESDFRWGVMENLGIGLYGKTLGIVGMGMIGREVARLANAFGMRVIYNKRTQLNASVESDLNITYSSLDNLLVASDIVSIHTPLTEDTHHLIGVREFVKMKTSALLINTARGPVINEDDLVDALSNNSIAGAALDVYENEPKIHPSLFVMNNVVIVPHIGTASIDCRIEMGKEAGANIINFFNATPTNIVN